MSGFINSSFVWNTLTEEERYEVWSLHIEYGGEPVDYSAFCDLMDGAHGTV